MKYYYVVRTIYSVEGEAEEICSMNDLTGTDIFSYDAVLFDDFESAVKAMNIILETAVILNKAVIDNHDEDDAYYYWDDEDYGRICEHLEIRTAVTFDKQSFDDL